MKIKKRVREAPMMGCHVHGCTQIASLILECEPLRGYCDHHDPRMETGALEIILDVSKALAALTSEQLLAFNDIEHAQEGNLDIHFDFDPDGVIEEEAARTDDPERRADLDNRLRKSEGRPAFPEHPKPLDTTKPAFFGTFHKGGE